MHKNNRRIKVFAKEVRQMKKYEEPKVEVQSYATEDIMDTSGYDTPEV